MNKTRKLIEMLKRDYKRALEVDIEKISKALLRELDYLMLKKNIGLNELLRDIERYLKVPKSYKAKMIRELSSAKKKIDLLWADYFGDELSKDQLRMIDAEYNVNFNKLDEAIMEKVKKLLRKNIVSKSGYEAFRNDLIKKGLSVKESSTLANTALSQYDNALMIEYAEESGVKFFKYDGVLHPDSRDFCRYHYGKIYTLSQIKQLDNGQGLPVLTSLGGYNCTHYWTPVLTNNKEKI